MEGRRLGIKVGFPSSKARSLPFLLNALLALSLASSDIGLSSSHLQIEDGGLEIEVGIKGKRRSTKFKGILGFVKRQFPPI